MKSIFSTVVLLFLLWFRNDLHAQNLVPNGDFESHTRCPYLDEFVKASTSLEHWVVPTQGTSDYFNTCANSTSNSNVGIPDNLLGSQAARSGNGYAGLFVAHLQDLTSFHYREYWQVPLNMPLLAGASYHFEMYVSLSERSTHAIKTFGAYISTDTLMNAPLAMSLLNVVPHVISGEYISDKNGWTKIEGEYIASGGERFLTIGNFSYTVSGALLRVTPDTASRGAYYYIDDVSLIKCMSPENLLGSDTTICSGGGVKLGVKREPGLIYQWNTSETSPEINVNTAGIYWLEIKAGTCRARDSIKVDVVSKPHVFLGNDTALCFQQPFTLKAPNNQFYLWNDGSNAPMLLARKPGWYWAQAANGACKTRDSVFLSALPVPVVNLGNDKKVCKMNRAF